MKLIHCADLHLDSSMTTHLSGEQAAERKRELINTFCKMVEYGTAHGAAAILIAGDLFDSKRVTALTRTMVLETISSHPEITFFYLKGNHDEIDLLECTRVCPDNLKLFDNQWTSYSVGTAGDGHVVISGMELEDYNKDVAPNTLHLDAKDVNIVMLHGMASEYGNDTGLSLRAYRNKQIDYLALGHIHAYQRESLDARGVYCYSGCLEPRGFDEPGEHGFVMLDIDEETGRCTDTFIPFATRQLHTIEVDITGKQSTAEIAACIRKWFCNENVPASHMLKLVLVGVVPVECEKDLDMLQKMFEDEVYFLKIYDESKLAVDYSRFVFDTSLKGEFVRTVMQEEALNEEEKAAIVRYGIMALAGDTI